MLVVETIVRFAPRFLGSGASAFRCERHTKKRKLAKEES
jgi:hypothetical protein